MTASIPHRSGGQPELRRDPGDEVEALFPVSPTSAAAARQLVSETCRRWERGGLCDDADLVVTELVANAIRHAGTPVKLRVARLRDGVRVEVGDDSQRPVRPRDTHPLDESGRGLFIVDVVASRWGVDAGPSGKTVWADLLG